MKHTAPLSRLLLLALTLTLATGCSAFRASKTSACESFAAALESARLQLDQKGSATPQCQMLSKEPFLATLTSLFAEEETPQEYVMGEIAFKGIGLIPSNYAYARCIKSAYISQASAGYSAKLKSVLIPSWYEIPFPILLHEATHFLQDEKVNTSSIQGYSGLFHDSALALGATFEGDAMMQEEQYIRAMNIDPDSVLLSDTGRLTPVEPACELPESLKRLFEFQYVQGKMFWERLQRFDPSLRRLDVLNNPPRSTREIIAPKEYLARTRNKLANTSGASCKVAAPPTALFRRSLGEFIFRITLEQTVSPRKSFEAARGLEDDCLTILPLTRGQKLEWILTFKGQKDRDEALAALQQRFKNIDIKIEVSGSSRITLFRVLR
jgi:hypothetical protein